MTCDHSGYTFVEGDKVYSIKIQVTGEELATKTLCADSYKGFLEEKVKPAVTNGILEVNEVEITTYSEA